MRQYDSMRARVVVSNISFVFLSLSGWAGEPVRAQASGAVSPGAISPATPLLVIKIKLL